jgi:hypothetical protein
MSIPFSMPFEILDFALVLLGGAIKFLQAVMIQRCPPSSVPNIERSGIKGRLAGLAVPPLLEPCPWAGDYSLEGRMAACALKSRCCPGQPMRKVARSIHEGARDLARDLSKTDAYVTSRRERKKVEMLFAHLKRILKLDRLRLRGPNGARTSSISLPPPRTSTSLQSSSQCCQPSPRHEPRVGSPQCPRLTIPDFFNTIDPSQTFRRKAGFPKSCHSFI